MSMNGYYIDEHSQVIVTGFISIEAYKYLISLGYNIKFFA